MRGWRAVSIVYKNAVGSQEVVVHTFSPSRGGPIEFKASLLYRPEFRDSQGYRATGRNP